MDDTGAQEATPLVHDGIMYLPNPRGVIQALDAATGDLIWEYRPGSRQVSGPAARRRCVAAANRPTSRASRSGPRLPRAAATRTGIQRNLAIFGDRIFGTTNDAHVIALDARTGKRGLGHRRSPIRSWATATRPARSSSAAK